MKKFSALLLVLGLQAALVGCSKTPWNKPPAQASSKSNSKVDPIEQDERAIEMNAERAKQNIDAIKSEAEDALRRTRQDLTAKATKHTSQASQLAADAVEAAKDRAEDVPDAVDRALDERQSDLRSRIRQRAEAEQRAVAEEEREDSDSNR